MDAPNRSLALDLEGRGRGARPSWAAAGEAVRLCLRRATLRRTGPIALVVGTILSLVNQAGVVAGGHATILTWVRVATKLPGAAVRLERRLPGGIPRWPAERPGDFT